MKDIQTAGAYPLISACAEQTPTTSGPASTWTFDLRVRGADGASIHGIRLGFL